MAAVCCRADCTRARGCGYTTTPTKASYSVSFIFAWCTFMIGLTGGGNLLRMQSRYIPIYTVEKAGFQHLLNTLDPRYKLPGRKHFGEVVLPRLYNTTRSKVTKKLEDVQFFSATTDLWSNRTMQPYLSLTVHFITDDWCLENACLQMSFFPSDHTGEEITQGLRDGLESWNLSEDRLVCMTTDSGTNMIKALRLNEWPNLQCFGHKLHNAISKYLHIICVCACV